VDTYQPISPYRNPEWDAELHRIAPRSDTAPWLHLMWEPGEPWEPVGRWVVYRMTHPDGLPGGMRELVMKDMNGPSPRSRGRWVQKSIPTAFVDPDGRPVMRKGVEVYENDPGCFISTRQWQLYRDTGHVGTPYWIIQGTAGGHKRRWSEQERKTSLLFGGPSEPPTIGDLCYAEPDERVWQKLRMGGEMEQRAELLALADRCPELFDDVNDEDATWDERTERRALQAWLSEAVDDATGWAGGAGAAFAY
jgi:hypothetical protein